MLHRSRIWLRRVCFLLPIASLLTLSAPALCYTQTTTVTEGDDLEGVRAAVYVTASQASGSSVALVNMFSWMNATTLTTNASHILGGGLADCDILVIPGGPSTGYSLELGEQGREIVKRFVEDGGSYFGVCGGANFACNYGLSFFNGSPRRPVPGVSDGLYMIELALNNSCSISGLSDEPSAFRTLYWQSSYFDPEDPMGIIPVATYTNSSLSPMIALQYGHGSVFLSSPHPEYEEDDDRDGTTAFDYLDDPESEWGIMMKIARWLVEVSSPASDTGLATGIPYVYLGIAGSAAVIAVAAIIVARRR